MGISPCVKALAQKLIALDVGKPGSASRPEMFAMEKLIVLELMTKETVVTAHKLVTNCISSHINYNCEL